MTWKKISLELVPPLEEGENTREPWTRKEKLKAARQKAAQLRDRITRRMGIQNLHEDLMNYGIHHFITDHPEVARKFLTVTKDGSIIMRDKTAMKAAHEAEHEALQQPKTVIPINQHQHDADESFYFEPIWDEFATARREVLTLEGKIPKDVK